MSHLKWLPVIALICPIHVCGQRQPSAQLPFAGCYQVVSQVWYPSNGDITLIPNRFELLTESAFGPSSGMFAGRSMPGSGDPTDWVWAWQPKGSRLWISWGTGLGGVRGTLKRSRNGEFVGKLKQWCDSHCAWKKKVAIIRIRQIDCSNP